jgi:hypothetical protein
MYQAPQVLLTLFHIHLDVARSEVCFVSSPEYNVLSRFPPRVIVTRLIFFVGSVVDNTYGVSDYPIAWDDTDVL